MKKGIIPVIVLLLTILFQSSAYADVYVDGYFKKDGTYVQPHIRSSPNGTPWDNWSTKGNINPYTGKEGTVTPYTNVPSYTPNYPTNIQQPSTVEMPNIVIDKECEEIASYLNRHYLSIPVSSYNWLTKKYEISAFNILKWNVFKSNGQIAITSTIDPTQYIMYSISFNTNKEQIDKWIQFITNDLDTRFDCSNAVLGVFYFEQTQVKPLIIFPQYETEYAFDGQYWNRMHLIMFYDFQTKVQNSFS